MWVVNLGDRLLSDPLLPQCLNLLGTLGRGRVIIVPGGGAFANQARLAKERWGFDNGAAHNMTVLAMTQSALMLQALYPRLCPVTQDADIRRALQQGHTALWTPLALLRQRPDELTHQATTSDALALWLARRLHAERLLLLGRCAADEQIPSADLAEMPVADQHLMEMARHAGCVAESMEHTNLDRLRELLTGPDCQNAPWP